MSLKRCVNVLVGFIELALVISITPVVGHALTISGNKVGIGTDTPTQTLHVGGNALVSGNLTINGSTSFSGSSSFSGNLTVNGITSFSGGSSFSGGITGDTTSTGDITVSGTGNGIVFTDGSIQTTAPGPNPPKVALLRWYEGNTAGNTFPAGTAASGVVFDGASIWMCNAADGNVMKLRASDGYGLGTYYVGLHPFALAFDGANIWAANYGNGTVTKLRASDGYICPTCTYSTDNSSRGVAFDGTNIWVTNSGGGTVNKLRASDGFLLGAYTVSHPMGIAFDGANMWVASWNALSISKF